MAALVGLGVASVLVLAAAPAAAEVPVRPAPSAPALVSMGGWEIFAEQMIVDGRQVRFERAEARREDGPRWLLRADHLVIWRAVTGEVDGLWGRGQVRLTGPGDLYVTAHQAASVQPRRYVEVFGRGEPATVGGADWRLGTRRARLHVDSGRVELMHLTINASRIRSRSAVERDDLGRFEAAKRRRSRRFRRGLAAMKLSKSAAQTMRRLFAHESINKR